ncbi:TonB-dependent receptor [Edaphobacter acidisoli]|uniref:TonB-dependent receptor n=1 Tax=Edaphobacter acidisoli TaxID=2040573 RepID=UPI0021DFF9ED|nr:carboxypeptidase regulatory-like domain-containing protein [Edaphobacter acidisoli]
MLIVSAVLLFCRGALASEYRGQVIFAGFPVPGAMVSATQGAKKFTTVTDQDGAYYFADLPDGAWKIAIEMQCFSTLHEDVTIAHNMPPAKWELQLIPLNELMARTKLMQAPPVLPPLSNEASNGSQVAANGNVASTPQVDASQANDGFLINGSVNNAATSRFSLEQAFGNRRPNSKSLYNGGLALILDNSAFDARTYSLSGQNTPKPAYNRITGALSLGGPLNIPHLMPKGPTFFVGYQWTRDHTAATESGLVPTQAERTGDLSALPVTIFNPATGAPFANNAVPVSPQAQALLQLYPLPNIAPEINSRYNYQIPVLNSSHQDVVQSRLEKELGRKDNIYGGFNLQSTRAGGTNLFNFVDTTDSLGMNTNVHWSHRFSQHLFTYAGYQFSRLRTQVRPWFENRENISGNAGIGGNNQDPTNWGPPALNFSSGIAALSDAQSSFNRNRTDAFSGSVALYHRHHNVTMGGDIRKQEYNDFMQQDPRGTFTFTGAATQGAGVTSGSDLADFLLGVPDTSSIAYGNADKYLRQTVYDLYASDDWRALSNLTLNVGVRWQYQAPITELRGRLVNLDVAKGFSAVAPVVGNDPVGALTGDHYPTSLIRPDKSGIEPRVALSWRPFAASTVVVRAGYGIYHDTSVYQSLALSLAQQAPLSKSLSVDNSAACPLTLADGFNPCSSITQNTFAVDPNLRVGYAQTWQLTMQRDLPFALQMTASYLGVKGTHGPQQFLPNTYPIGAGNPCPACPAGFVYQTSGGNSTRQAAQLQLRRRLRSGFTASLIYTYSKSMDDDAFLGGQSSSSPQSSRGPEAPPTVAAASSAAVIAQNWLDLRSERSPSSFDQRHLLNAQLQYTSGEGLGGGTLMSGWRGRLLKEWTFMTRISAGSGLPQTPVYLAAVPGTGYTGPIRPDLTGEPISSSQPGVHLNAAAYAAPIAGQWGDAGRNSITGPAQFSLDAALARTFRPSSRFYLDARIDATNVLNRGVFTGWITTVNSAQFGLPLAANPMRSLETTVRLRF